MSDDFIAGTGKPARYLQHYQRELARLPVGEVNVLELGVQSGYSLVMWKDWFAKGLVVGVDLNSPPPIEDSTGRIRVLQGFQQDDKVLNQALEIAPSGFDLIVDDASHLAEYTAASFFHLFPNLKPGGIYVLEDWTAGYHGDWPDGQEFAPPSMPAMRWERLRRGARIRARAIAGRMPQPARSRMARLYGRLERTVVHRNWPSHDAGMVGLLKQIIDTCGRGMDDVAWVTVTPGLAFIHKNAVGNDAEGLFVDAYRSSRRA